MTWTDEDEPDRILAQTTALLSNRGDEEAVALMIDVRTVEFELSDEVARSHENEWGFETHDYFKVVKLDVEDHLVGRFSEEVRGRILRAMKYVADRNGVEDLRYLIARPALPDVDDQWRETYGARLDAGRPSNQARRERDLPKHPTQDGLTFGSEEELRVYRVLRKLQGRLSEDDSIAILPLPGARLQAGHTWSPDFLVTGRGRAVVIEVDGPHHRTLLRRADDANRDLQWQRCGVGVVRLPVEDLKQEAQLEARLCEEFRRHLPRRAA